MQEKDAFYTVSNLDDKGTAVPADQEHRGKAGGCDRKADGTTGRLIGSLVSDIAVKQHGPGKSGTAAAAAVTDIPGEMTEALQKALTEKLLRNFAPRAVKNVASGGLKDRVIARFFAPAKNISCDIELPLDITANDLIVGLNKAYDLGIDISDMQQCYMSCENPVALLRGKRLLGEFGIRDGSLITYYR